MTLRLAFLKKIKGEDELMLEYDEDQVLARLQARIRENLSAKENYFIHRWGKKDVASSVAKAFNELIQEFKEETIRLA